MIIWIDAEKAFDKIQHHLWSKLSAKCKCKENRDRLREWADSSGCGSYEVEGVSETETGLMDMDNSVVMAGGNVRGLNGNGKIQ